MIPKRPLIDTCVLAAAVPPESHQASIDALHILKETGAKPMISMVIYAELSRGAAHGGKSRIPAGIQHVSFDMDVADALARHFPTKTMKVMGSKTEREFWNFDALIFATAIASGADAIITNNASDFRTLLREADYADEIKVRILEPRQVGEAQQGLAFPERET